MTLPAQIPLFPLNVVLFPGMLLPLHIFEPRYRKMLNDCVNRKEPFGLVLATNAETPHAIGTAAHIDRVERLPDGRSNILVAGKERFRVTGFAFDEPYLVGRVEPFPPRDGETAEAKSSVARITTMFRDYLSALEGAIGQQIRVGEIPDDAETLAYLVAIALQVSLEVKQSLLEIPAVPELLKRERQLLETETALLRYMERTRKLADDAGPYTPN